MSVTIDVIIPVYNGARFLAGCIEHVLLLQPPVHQIIIVDDCSTDNPEGILPTNEKIIFLRNDKNEGPASSRNKGIRAAKADFIQFLDADDYLSEGKWQKQVQFFAENPQADAVFGDVVLFEDGTSREKGTIVKYAPDHDIVAQLIQKNVYAIHAFLFRRRFFEQFGFFDTSLRIGEDRELYLRGLSRGATFLYQPGCNVYYRRHPRSAVATKFFEGAFGNAQALLRNTDALRKQFGNQYDGLLSNSLRMLARNANLHGRPWHEVVDLLKKASEFSNKQHIQQNSVYNFIENCFGALFLEVLLRPKFVLDRRFKTFT
jgi:glycosyltransferase involved in cell wall biosynthesis